MSDMDSDTTHFNPVDPGNQGGQRRPPRWSGRTKRFITTAAAGAVLLGSGAVIGFAMTGGASAATGSPAVGTSTSSAPASPTPAASTATGSGGTGQRASRCTKLVEELVLGNHLKLAERLRALCTHPLLRLALIGGEHGTVTFKSKTGTTTAVFERGTVQSDTGSVITVTAADGTTWTWDITSSTVVRQAGSTATVGTGDQVFVAGTLVSGANDARLIRIQSTG
jgi:hypothetical protein